MWEDVDLALRRISIRRTLIKAGPEPVLGPPKVGKSGAVAISPQTANLLKRHKVKQSEWKLSVGSLYHDHDFVFAKDDGFPLQINNFAQRSFARLIEKAGVKTIRFHDLRHTCATLLLEKGVNPKIVQERLGHSDISMTLNRYSHLTGEQRLDFIISRREELNAKGGLESVWNQIMKMHATKFGRLGPYKK